MRNPNLKILLIAVVLIAAVAAVGLMANRDLLSPTTPSEPAADGQPVAYLRIQVDDQIWAPIALADGDEYTIEQPNGAVNVVRANASSIVMHSSTCDNQSCVEQGEVTLENRDMRVLSNMIICLPNQVILELLTPAEAGMEAAQ